MSTKGVPCSTAVDQLGIDETSSLAANRSHATVSVTGLAHLQAKVVIDMVEGKAAAELRPWSAQADPGWLAGIEVVATDLAESFRSRAVASSRPRPPGGRPFYVVSVGNRCLEKVRRRVQNETLSEAPCRQRQRPESRNLAKICGSSRWSGDRDVS